MKIKWRREQPKLCENFYLSKQKTVLPEKTCKAIMAFPLQGGQESQNRQILQDLQQKRQMLLSQGQAGTGNIGRSTGSEASTSTSVVNIKPHEAPIIRNPTDMSLSQRQALEHANATSSGYFISQDSAYGNLILPVLPRFENDQQ